MCRRGRDPAQTAEAWSRSSRGLTCRLQRLHGDWGAASRAGLDGSDLDEAAGSAGDGRQMWLQTGGIAVVVRLRWIAPVLAAGRGEERRAVESREGRRVAVKRKQNLGEVVEVVASPSMSHGSPSPSPVTGSVQSGSRVADRRFDNPGPALGWIPLSARPIHLGIRTGLTLACSESQEEQGPFPVPHHPNPPKLPPSCPLIIYATTAARPAMLVLVLFASGRTISRAPIDVYLVPGFLFFGPHSAPRSSAGGGLLLLACLHSTHMPTHSFPVFNARATLLRIATSRHATAGNSIRLSSMDR